MQGLGEWGWAGVYEAIKIKIQLKYSNKQGEQQQDQMTDKNKLIESMANLIQHVSSSHKNQEEIFSTLSITDVNKILTNLDDTNERLRKTTLMLLAELLYDSVSLQRKFCQLTGIPQLTGKIVLSRTFPKNIMNDPQVLQQTVKVLKDDLNQKQKGLFWYIDSASKPKILQIGKRNSITIDPLNCIVGVWLLDDTNSITNTRDTKAGVTIMEKQDKYERPENINHHLYLPFPKYQLKNVNPVNGKVRLNRSQHIEKYQEHVFKPETPMKGSLTQDQNGFITTRARDTKNYTWVPQTPTISKQQPKQIQTYRYPGITMSDSKNQPSVSTFDTIRYIKPTIYSPTIPQTAQQTQRAEYRGFDQIKNNQKESLSNSVQYSNSSLSGHGHGQYGGNVVLGQDQGYYRMEFRKN